MYISCVRFSNIKWNSGVYTKLFIIVTRVDEANTPDDIARPSFSATRFISHVV